MERKYNEIVEQDGQLFFMNDFAECYEIDHVKESKNCLTVYKSGTEAFTLQIRTFKPINGSHGTGKPRNMIAHVSISINDLHAILAYVERKGYIMAYSKKAIRHMPPQVRKFARLVNELDSTTKRLRNLINASDIFAMPPTSAKQRKGKVTMRVVNLEDGQELFPLHAGQIDLAVRPSETTTETEARELAEQERQA